ncbi:uncharacterized protein [Procambarus clarkii]|uniref:uncharacterized protein isoform X1 n=1 Tax=Procambarus clarkii TaxID=6728 RepID=UPI00374214DE
MQTAPTIKKKKILDLGMVDDTESSTMSVTNPFTAAALRPQVSRINMPGRSTPASILADSFLAPENYLYLPDVPRITPDNNDEGLQTLAILAKENLHREYFKINSALQKKCEYMKRSLNIEDQNYLKPSNKKGKGENYCRIIEINQTQRSNLSEAHGSGVRLWVPMSLRAVALFHCYSTILRSIGTIGHGPANNFKRFERKIPNEMHRMPGMCSCAVYKMPEMWVQL